MQKQDRPEIFWELTRSICPECKTVIDAKILLRDGKVYMRKRCPEHGEFEALFFGDAQLYTDIQPFNKPGTLPLQFATEVRDGCPHDCGLCPDHQQHACLALIEVNQACNLDCPLCFANAGTHLAHSGWQLTYEQVEFMLDSFIAAEGNPEVVQFSGGEPSLHPQILDFIKLAQDKGIDYVMLNTNGIRIARDDAFLAGLAELKPHIYLQFDGLEARTNEVLRGRADLLKDKVRALDRLAEVDVRAVLVAAIERGVNEHEIGAITEFGLRHPAVFGINFQPAFRAQRHIPADPLTRMTIPDVLKGLEAQTGGLFKLSDFVPVPCCMPTCNFVTYAMIDGDAVTPITRVLDVDFYLDYIKNRTMPALNDDLLKSLEMLWSSSAQVGSDRDAAVVRNIAGSGNGRRSAGGTQHAAGSHSGGPADEAHGGIGGQSEIVHGKAGASSEHTENGYAQQDTVAAARCASCHSHLPLSAHAPRDLAKHVFMINTRDFMDPWTFSVKNVMKCCVEFLTPDGRMIPFCAYNTIGYREQVNAMMQTAA